MKRGPLLVALFLAALTLRPQIVGIGPLLPSIQDGLGVSHAVAGLLATIPVLCMGLFAPPAPYLSARIGSRRAMTVAVSCIAAFGLARALAPEAAGVVLLTIGVGVGMGLGGAILPVLVKERFADRPGFATGVYTLGMAIGAAVPAAVAVPLAHAAGGWRTPLVCFSAVSAVLAALWVVLTRSAPDHVRTGVRPLRLPLRSPLAWRLVGCFFCMSTVFYGLNTWLSDAYVEWGWSESSAGALVGLLNVVTIPCGFLVAWAADHRGQRRLWLAGAASLQLAGVLGIVLAHDAGWLWAVVLGIAIGPLFPLMMTLPLDAAERPAEVAALAGMMLGLGYTFGAVSPLLLGALRDRTGGFEAVMWALSIASAGLVAFAFSFSPARLAGNRSPLGGAGPA